MMMAQMPLNKEKTQITPRHNQFIYKITDWKEKLMEMCGVKK